MKYTEKPDDNNAEVDPLLSLLDAADAETERPWCDCAHILPTVSEYRNLLTVKDCDILIESAIATAKRMGGWGCNKEKEAHGTHKTQDVKMWNLEDQASSHIYRNKIVGSLARKVEKDFRLPPGKVTVADAFLVRYTCEEKWGQRKLGPHRDGSIVSATISLNPHSDFEGGGTSLCDNGAVYLPKQGSAVMFAGSRMHEGVEITRGTRYIVSVFFECTGCNCRDESIRLFDVDYD